MKMAIAALLLCAVAMLATGCNSLSKLTGALAKDPATATAKITSIYGVAQLARVGVLRPGQTATVSPDGTITVTYPLADTVSPAAVERPDVVNIPMRLDFSLPSGTPVKK